MRERDDPVGRNARETMAVSDASEGAELELPHLAASSVPSSIAASRTARSILTFSRGASSRCRPIWPRDADDAEPLSDDVVREIVDDIFLPLVRKGVDRSCDRLSSNRMTGSPMAEKTGFAKRFPTRRSAAVTALAANVRRLRTAKEWSQDRLAEAIGVEQNAISLIENGRSNPTLVIIEAIADALDADTKDLFEAPARGASR
jgi:DNA-binding XRE family transcriptional regulator